MNIYLKPVVNILIWLVNAEKIKKKYENLCEMCECAVADDELKGGMAGAAVGALAGTSATGAKNSAR